MTSILPGASTLDVELTNVSSHGFWLLLGPDELFVPFAEFPWFKEAPIGHLMNVERPQPHHLYWPDLDIDLSVDSILRPNEFHLVARVRT
jgi:hypothetical protein